MTALDKGYPLFSFFAVSIDKQINHMANVSTSFIKLTLKRTHKAIHYFELGASLLGHTPSIRLAKTNFGKPQFR